MELLFALISFVFGILSLILFFKVWGMCNNVARIRELIEADYFKRYEEPKNASSERSKKFSAGDKVVILKNGKVTTVTSVIGEEYECAISNEKSASGLYRADELNKF